MQKTLRLMGILNESQKTPVSINKRLCLCEILLEWNYNIGIHNRAAGIYSICLDLNTRQKGC